MVQSRRERRTSFAGWGAAAMLLAIWGLLIAQATAVLISEASDLGGAEVFVIYTLTAARDGRPLYPDVLEPPFCVTQYSPLFYWASLTVVDALGIPAAQPERIAAVARAASSLAWFGVAALVFGTWRRLGLPRLWAFAAATFSAIGAGHFPFQARPDALEVFWSVSAAMLLWRCSARRGWQAAGALFAAGVCGGLAAIAKQNGVETLAFALLAGWIVKRWSVPIWFLGGFAFVVAAATAPAFSVHGWALKHHLLDGVNNGVDWLWSLEKAYVRYATFGCASLAVGVGLGLGRLRSPVRPDQRVLAAFVLTSLLANGVAALKYGSAENYFMEFGVLALMLLGSELSTRTAPTPRPWLAVGLTAVLLAAFVQASNFAIARIIAKRFYSSDLSLLRAELDRRLAEDPKAWFVSADPRLPVLYPRRSIVGQLLLVSLMHQRRIFDYRRYFEAIADGSLRYHIVDVRSGPPGKVYRDQTNLEAPLATFREIGRFGPYLLLENPRPRP